MQFIIINLNYVYNFEHCSEKQNIFIVSHLLQYTIIIISCS